jgi:hypothetical protein
MAAPTTPIICDFCSSTNVHWTFLAKPHSPMAGVVSDGGWAACNVCKDLILLNDRDGLAERTYVTLIEIDPDFSGEEMLEPVKGLILDIQKGFWENKYSNDPIRYGRKVS